jgi:hypothetical protein
LPPPTTRRGRLGPGLRARLDEATSPNEHGLPGNFEHEGEVVDPYLVSIAKAVEAGKPAPFVNLMTSAGDWIAGQPCTTAEYREIRLEALRAPDRERDE